MWKLQASIVEGRMVAITRTAVDKEDVKPMARDWYYGTIAVADSADMCVSVYAEL